MGQRQAPEEKKKRKERQGRAQKGAQKTKKERAQKELKRRRGRSHKDSNSSNTSNTSVCVSQISKERKLARTHLWISLARYSRGPGERNPNPPKEKGHKGTKSGKKKPFRWTLRGAAI